MQPRSLQGRLLALVLATVSLVWLAASALTWWDAQHELAELLDSHLAQAAALLVAQQVREIEDDERIDAPLLHRYAPKTAFQVWHEGRLAMRSSNAPAGPMARHARGFETLAQDGTRWRIFAARGAERDVQVYVGERLDSRDAILRGMLRGLLGPMLVALPLMAAALWWAVRRGLLPLRRIGSAIAQREPQALQPIAGGALPAELVPLVASLNGLFARIAALLDSERRFTADAAHELRTPIAAIRAQAQVAQVASGDEAVRRHALQATIDACDRATRLVEQLLTLARLESSTDAGGARDAIELDHVAGEVLAELAPAALARDQSLELDADSAVPVRGSATLLSVLVRNLADNALRYSPDGARVVVTVRRQQGQPVLTVEDSGAGLSADQQQRLGERFFRALGNAATGSGLGWSIVRRIAAVHRAEVTTGRSAALGGLSVRVQFGT